MHRVSHFAGVAFTAWVPAKAAVPGLEDVAKASPEALVAGLSGLYKPQPWSSRCLPFWL